MYYHGDGVAPKARQLTQVSVVIKRSQILKNHIITITVVVGGMGVIFLFSIIKIYGMLKTEIELFIRCKLSNDRYVLSI